MTMVTTTDKRHGDQRDARQQRADGEHHDQHPDQGEHRGDDLGEGLLQGGGDVVDVVGHPAQGVAARVVVEVLERQAGQLEVHLLAQAVDHPLHDAGHDVALQPLDHGGHQVDEGGQGQDAPQRREVHSLPGREGHAREHGGELRLSLGAQQGDGLLLGHPAGSLLADDPLEDEVGGAGEDLGPDDGEGDADRGQHHGQADDEAVPGAAGRPGAGRNP